MTERKKLLVSGCSITHGCETYNVFMHQNNVTNSYSHLLAEMLDVDLINVALSGGSNDHVFFSLMDLIQSTPADQIHSVIAAWTSPGRLTLKSNDRYWLYIGAFAATSKPDTFGELDFPAFKRNIEKNNVWFNVDDPAYMDELIETHKFFVNNYLTDINELTNRLKIYSASLNAICSQKGIKLVELKMFDIPELQAYKPVVPKNRHPTVEEHKRIANELYNVFYA